MKRMHILKRSTCSYLRARYYSGKPHVREDRRIWQPVIGLEIHAQIPTVSKLFSGAATRFGSPINTQVAVFDAAMPGTLPVINRGCVEAGILTALAINSNLNMVSKFDRKHYFYSDLPSGFQITQYRQPLAVGGYVQYVVQDHSSKHIERKKIHITQLQLEQDSGKSLHDTEDSISLIDLNRAGVGLMEIITEPEFHSSEEAMSFVKELQLIFQCIGTCDGRMDEGSMRVDASVSVHHPGEPLGTRSEVKNLNSTRYVGRAIDFEVKRQIEILESGGEVANETRAFDFESGETIPMRDKEHLHDYRFMPEPNLPPLRLYSDASPPPPGVATDQVINIDRLKERLPELPEEKRGRMEAQYGLTLSQAIILVGEPGLMRYFEEIMSEGKRNVKVVVNLLLNDLLRVLNKDDVNVDNSPVLPSHIGEIVDMLQSNTISMATAKKVLDLIYDGEKRSPTQLVSDNHWTQITDQQALVDVCQTVIEQNPVAVEEYRKGKTKVLNFLMGQVMKATKGRVDPKATTNTLKSMLQE
ncbi:hypothetical protein NP493_652g04026 [Ridgeia piscesae]|uniref:Glutamyl-tRNA(Gln) amidotransferase subunit B, mitochondrial n=1 Tax=Ridgeia piscesae TaxID=27915 RepID=A0AAD9KSD5_RIDPI|nr:hypothetical protein NP493_652g04026 [Ridgeia piscesae]